MFEYDITFCSNQSCPHVRCMRHHTKIPQGVPISVALFQPSIMGNCDYRFDDDWETVEDAQEQEE